MLKVGIVGCGKIADSHAAQVKGIPGCEIVGVCDREMLMAQQLADRFPIKSWYRDVTELLADAQTGRCSYHDSAAKPLRYCKNVPGMGLPCLSREAFYGGCLRG